MIHPIKPEAPDDKFYEDLELEARRVEHEIAKADWSDEPDSKTQYAEEFDV